MQSYLFLGDSITDCNHSFDPENLGYGYVRMIHEALQASGQPYQVINKGNDGFTVSSVRRLWNQFCKDLSPDFITILVGINDLSVILENQLTLSAALSDFQDRYTALLQEIRKTTDCPIVLMEPFIFPYPAVFATWEAPLRAMGERIQTIANMHGADFLPLSDLLLEAGQAERYSAITTDGIHLTKEGHRLVANQWLTHLQTLRLR